MEINWDKYARNSLGWEKDPIAIAHVRIFLGSAKSVDPVILATLGVSHVVNCAENEFSSSWFVEDYPGRHACIGAFDSIHEDITHWYPLFESVMNSFISSPDCRNIYVHCQCGINRSPFLLLIYMCLKFDLEPSNVIKNILKQRPCAFQNPSFRIQAINYIKKHRD
jgi:hypothetical protein